VSNHRARSLSRRLALQALYQLQVNPRPWQDIYNQYAGDEEAERVDAQYFRELFEAIAGSRESLDERMKPLSEIAPHELDPIEHAILWLGLHELEARPELPYRVAISEAVELTKRFGATDGHKFVNAVLDKAARQLRPQEYGQPAA
jgi:transcription antitermination protein NusB